TLILGFDPLLFDFKTEEPRGKKKQGDSGGQDANIKPVVEATDTIVEDAAPVQSRRQGKRKYVAVDVGGASHPPKKLREDHGTLSGDSIGEDEVDSLIRSFAPIMTTVTTTTPTVDTTSVTKEKVVEPSLFGVGSFSASGTDPIIGVFSDLTSSDFLMVDKFAPLKFFASVREMEHDHLFTEFNVGAARQMSLSAEVRLRAEHNVKEKRILKYVVKSQGELLKAREEEIGSPKARLLLKEAEAVEAIRLRAKASNFETVEKSLRDDANALRERNVFLEKERAALDVKVTEFETSAMSKKRELTDLNALVTSIKSQNDSLVGQVHELEISSFGLQEKVTVYENCMEQLEKFQDYRMKIVEDKFDKLYTDFVEMALHLEEQFYPHLLTTISGRMWLLTYGIELAITKCLNSLEYLSALGSTIGKAIEKGMQDGLAAGITNGKEGRVLTDVVAHNPSTKADYISALQQLQNVNFPLFADLKSNKDASVEAIMEILRLEDPVAKKLGLNDLQPNVDQLMVPIHSSSDKVFIGATALSLALDASSSRVWQIRENIANHRSVVHDVFVLLAEPFFTSALTGVEGTYGTMPTTSTTMALSTTLALTNIVNPISIDDYEFVDADDQAVAGGDTASFPNVDDAELHIPKVVMFSIFALLVASRIAACSLFSSKRSRLIPRASLFCTRSTSVVLNVDILISAGMTTFVSYVNKNEVSPLLDFIMVRTAMKMCLELAFVVDSLEHVYELNNLGMLLLVTLRPYAWVSSVRYSKIGVIQAFLFSLLGTCLIENTLKLLVSVHTFSRFVSISHAPEPSMQEDPSVNKIHGSGSASSASIRVSRKSSSGCSAMNFLPPGLPIIPFYEDDDLTTTKFIQAEAECSLSLILTSRYICPIGHITSPPNPFKGVADPPSTYMRCMQWPLIFASMIIGPSVPSSSSRGRKRISVLGEKLCVILCLDTLSQGDIEIYVYENVVRGADLVRCQSTPFYSQMHNNIMAAGSRDRPPMLAPGRYPQWRLRFLRYVDIRPNGEALRKCILSGPYKPTTVLVQAFETTDNSPAVPEHTTVETSTNMSPENKAHFLAEKEAIHLILTGIRDDIYLTVDAFQTAQEMSTFNFFNNFSRNGQVNELRAEKLARNANPLALVTTAQASQDPYYQSSRSYRSSAPSPKPSIPSRSHTTTRHKGKKIAKPITPPSETASEEDSDPEQAQRDKDMQKNLALIAKQFGTQRTVNVAGTREKVGSQVVQKSGIQCFNFKEYGHFVKKCRKPKRVKDFAYHKEKMLLCKQAEQDVSLQAEQYDWLADTDEEVDEQELEAHYSYMAKIQEVRTADSGTDSEPVEQNEQNDVESDDERVVLANLKLDVDENKRIPKQLKKANTTLAQELKECKAILAETSKSLRSLLVSEIVA
nr:nonaspanin [Tanacetum cinerariifolium]